MNDPVKNFEDLLSWRKGHQLALAIYQLTQHFPKHEVYGLTSQIRRAASSVSANIAEGFERYHFNDKIRFYYHARGSAAEVQNFLHLAKDLTYIRVEDYQQLNVQAVEVRRLINGMIRSIEKQQ